jgi:lysosome membrane protein 2
MHREKQTCGFCTPQRLKWSSVGLTVFALALIGIAVWVPPVILKALDDGIKDVVILTPQSKADNSDGYRLWADWTDANAVPVYYNVYMQNTTNAEDVLQGAVPNVVEVGPYAFREYRMKLNVSFQPDPITGKDTIKYKEWIYYVFDSAKSKGQLSDVVTIPNLIFKGIQSAAPMWCVIYIDAAAGPPNPNTYYNYTDMERLFQRRPVGELLFGFDDDPAFTRMFSTNPMFPGLVGQNYTNATQAMDNILSDTIFVGSKNDNELTRSYVEWKEQRYGYSPIPSTPPVFAYASQSASQVYGTDATQFPRNIKEGQDIFGYVNEVLRGVRTRNVNNTHINVHGIDLLRFTLANETMVNSTINTDNREYYMDQYNGVLNATGVQGFPMYITKPHWLDADDLRRASGIPYPPADRNLHDIYLDVEPLSGATMNAAKRLQLNIPMSGNVDCQSMPAPFNYTMAPKWTNEWVFPVMWVEEVGTVTESVANDFKKSVYGAQNAAYYIGIVCWIVGTVFVGFGVILFFIAMNRQYTVLSSLNSHEQPSAYSALHQ